MQQLMGLAYIGVNSTSPDEWRAYATDVLGLALADQPGDAELRFRMDDRRWRLAVHAAEYPGLAYVGWELTDERALDDAVARIEAAGLTVTVETGELAAIRGVTRLAAFEAPGGHRHELVYGAAIEGHFVSPLGVGFRTGDLGMGHVVLTIPDAHYQAAMAFYQDVLGFRVSEYLDFEPVQGALMHCGPRHHSLGIVNAGQRPGCDHIMIECEDADDVGRCWDRVLNAGIEIRRMIGRHADDHVFSFYMATPSKLGLEYGAESRLIDPETWRAETLSTAQSGDVWGHQPPSGLTHPIAGRDGPR